MRTMRNKNSFMHTQAKMSLHMAAAQGNLSTVKRKILEGVPLDARDECERTPLFHAAWYGHVNLGWWLLENGANVSAQNHKGETPLHIAIKSENVEVVRILLHYGASVNISDANGRTPINLAKASTVSEMRSLVESGMNSILQKSNDTRIGRPRRRLPSAQIKPVPMANPRSERRTSDGMLQARISALQEERVKLLRIRKEHEDKIVSLETEKITLQTGKTQAEIEKQNFKNALTFQKEGVRRLQEAVSAEQMKNDLLSSQLERTIKERDKTEIELEKFKKKAKHHQKTDTVAELNELRNALEKEQRKVKLQAEMFLKKEKDVKKLTEEIGRVKSDNSVLENIMESLGKQVKNLQGKNEEIIAEVKRQKCILDGGEIGDAGSNPGTPKKSVDVDLTTAQAPPELWRDLREQIKELMLRNQKLERELKEKEKEVSKEKSSEGGLLIKMRMMREKLRGFEELKVAHTIYEMQNNDFLERLERKDLLIKRLEGMCDIMSNECEQLRKEKLKTVRKQTRAKAKRPGARENPISISAVSPRERIQSALSPSPPKKKLEKVIDLTMENEDLASSTPKRSSKRSRPPHMRRVQRKSNEVYCKNAHVMQYSEGVPFFPNGLQYPFVECDACGKRGLDRATHFWHCEACSYDLCAKCANRNSDIEPVVDLEKRALASVTSPRIPDFQIPAPNFGHRSKRNSDPTQANYGKREKHRGASHTSMTAVDRILAHRKNGNENEYLVKWQGCPESENSWEHEDCLTNEMVHKYRTKTKPLIPSHDMKPQSTIKSKPISKYKCISWSHIPKSWHGSIRHNGRHIYVKQSRCEVEVALAINEKCNELGIALKNPSVEAYRKIYEASKKPGTKFDPEDLHKIKRSDDFPTSLYRNVYWDKTRNQWTASISFEGRRYYLRGFLTDKEAAEALYRKCRELGFQPKNLHVEQEGERNDFPVENRESSEEPELNEFEPRLQLKTVEATTIDGYTFITDDEAETPCLEQIADETHSTSASKEQQQKAPKSSDILQLPVTSVTQFEERQKRKKFHWMNFSKAKRAKYDVECNPESKPIVQAPKIPMKSEPSTELVLSSDSESDDYIKMSAKEKSVETTLGTKSSEDESKDTSVLTDKTKLNPVHVETHSDSANIENDSSEDKDLGSKCEQESPAENLQLNFAHAESNPKESEANDVGCKRKADFLMENAVEKKIKIEADPEPKGETHQITDSGEKEAYADAMEIPEDMNELQDALDKIKQDFFPGEKSDAYETDQTQNMIGIQQLLSSHDIR